MKSDKNLIKFLQKYDTEYKCYELFRDIRMAEGVTCKRCKCTSHYWLGTRDRFRCKQCNWETTLKSGTVLESSKLPYSYWIYAMAFIAHSKKPISTLEMQRLLGHKFYEPIFHMMHKLRVTMSNREAIYKLNNHVESDEAFFEISTGSKQSTKRGAGTEQKSRVSVQTETVPGDLRLKGKKKRGSFKFVKMTVIEDCKSETLSQVVKENVNPQATLKTDGATGYISSKLNVHKHIQLTLPGKLAAKHLPWVHIMISNAKRNFLGIYHSVSDQYLQNYLSEFCYFTNRRYLDDNKMNNLLNLSVKQPWYRSFVQTS